MFKVVYCAFLLQFLVFCIRAFHLKRDVREFFKAKNEHTVVAIDDTELIPVNHTSNRYCTSDAECVQSRMEICIERLGKCQVCFVRNLCNHGYGEHCVNDEHCTKQANLVCRLWTCSCGFNSLWNGTDCFTEHDNQETTVSTSPTTDIGNYTVTEIFSDVTSETNQPTTQLDVRLVFLNEISEYNYLIT
jgi:hypothetical protein